MDLNALKKLLNQPLPTEDATDEAMAAAPAVDVLSQEQPEDAADWEKRTNDEWPKYLEAMPEDVRAQLQAIIDAEANKRKQDAGEDIFKRVTNVYRKKSL